MAMLDLLVHLSDDDDEGVTCVQHCFVSLSYSLFALKHNSENT